MADRWQEIRCPHCGGLHDAREVYIYAGALTTVYHEELAVDRAYYAGELCKHERWLAAEREERHVTEMGERSRNYRPARRGVQRHS